MAPSAKRPVQPEDLYRLETLVDCCRSPDGTRVAYVVSRVDPKTEKRHADLWVVATKGGRPRRFTYGDDRDLAPRWSPDGRQIAFLSNRGDEKQPQIHLLPTDGGEARPLTRLEGTFGEVSWSPDGRRLLFAFRKKDPDEKEREKDERKKKLGVVSRHVTRTLFKLDDAGFLPRERWHLWQADVRTGRATQLTDGEVFDEAEATYTPDGESVVFLSNRAADPDLDPDAVDLFVVPARGGRARRIDTPAGPKGLPRVSPDGRLVAYVGSEGRGLWWKNSSLWVVPLDGRGPARDLTAAHDLHVSAGTIHDMGDTPLSAPTWSRDGARLFFQVTRRGNTELCSVRADGTGLEVLIDDPGAVGAYGLDPEEQTVAYVFAERTDPGQVRLRELSSGTTRALTDLNRALRRRWDLGRVEEVWVDRPGGGQVHGWVLTPPGRRTRQKRPTILEIHGGPRVQYGNVFMHEFQVLAGRGYVVAFCNPLGSQGYGEAHARAIWNAWGTVDYDDLMTFADHVAARPDVDPARMGVTGGSYGGYMTNWIVGHTDRFRAAVTQRSVSNLLSMWGSSDFNWLFQQEIGQGPPWEAFETLWARSPMSRIGAARTPTLVIHSEQDLRCAIEQGEQIFVALKRLGVETEMVRFPDEPHGLSRTGRTDRRIVRLEHILRWFDRFLKAPTSRARRRG